MTFKKITSVVAGILILATSLAPMQVSALSAASLSLAGATNTTGVFSTVIYGNTGADDANTASVAVSFSGGSVSGVSYDYNVGQFHTQTPSGAYGATGKGPSGTFPIAAVRFTIASPATVNATATGSLKHAVRDANGVATGDNENFAVSAGSASFTYNAPAQGGMGGGPSTGSTGNTGTTTTTTSGHNTAVAQNTTTSIPAAASTPTAATTDIKAQTKGDATKNSDNKKDATQNTAAKKHSVWPWIVLVVVAGAAIAYVLRNRGAASENKQADAKVVKPAADDKPVKTAAVAVPVAAAKDTEAKENNAKPAAHKRRRNRHSGNRNSGNKNR